MRTLKRRWGNREWPTRVSSRCAFFGSSKRSLRHVRAKQRPYRRELAWQGSLPGFGSIVSVMSLVGDPWALRQQAPVVEMLLAGGARAPLGRAADWPAAQGSTAARSGQNRTQL